MEIVECGQFSFAITMMDEPVYIKDLLTYISKGQMSFKIQNSCYDIFVGQTVWVMCINSASATQSQLNHQKTCTPSHFQKSFEAYIQQFNSSMKSIECKFVNLKFFIKLNLDVFQS